MEAHLKVVQERVDFLNDSMYDGWEQELSKELQAALIEIDQIFMKKVEYRMEEKREEKTNYEKGQEENEELKF